MSEITIILITTLVSLITSVLTVLATTYIKNWFEVRKAKDEHKFGFSKLLLQQRIKYYPELYRHLSHFAKLLDKNEQNEASLIALNQEINDWNSCHAIFFTNHTMEVSGHIRKLLNTILENNIVLDFKPEDWSKMRQVLGFFEACLKAEIGIFTLKAIEDIADPKGVNIFIEEMVKRSENLKPSSQKNLPKSKV